jgi:hypothetical protein
LQYGLQHQTLKLRRLVDRKMIDAGLAADIDIREFAMKAGAAVHIGESALRYVRDAKPAHDGNLYPYNSKLRPPPLWIDEDGVEIADQPKVVYSDPHYWPYTAQRPSPSVPPQAVTRGMAVLRGFGRAAL